MEKPAACRGADGHAVAKQHVHWLLPGQQQVHLLLARTSAVLRLVDALRPYCSLTSVHPQHHVEDTKK